MAYQGKVVSYSEKALLEKAEIQGFLSTADLAEYSSEEGGEPEWLSQVVRALRKKGVRIVEEADDEPSTPDEEEPIELEGQSNLEYVSSDDAVSLYLREMSLTPLLSFEEEVSLAKRIERGQQAHIQLLKSNGSGNESDRKQWQVVIDDGLDARDSLIRANTRLVISIARRYLGGGLPFLDLIQEGNLGLIKAVEKYEYRRGFRFSTYATWWIRQSITRALADQGRTIRIPVHMVDRLRQLYKVTQEMEQSLGRVPTPDELADKMELDTRKIRWMLQVAQSPVSLESPMSDEDDSELGTHLEDESSPSPSQVAYLNILHEKVEEVLATLSPREARVLRMRFGLGHDRPHTLEEVGQKFGLTRERIRQIEGKALRRLRHPSRARHLREYL